MSWLRANRGRSPQVASAHRLCVDAKCLRAELRYARAEEDSLQSAMFEGE